MKPSGTAVTALRDALLAEASDYGVSLDHFGDARCWAEPLSPQIAWGPNLSSDGDIIAIEDDPGEPAGAHWTMYRDLTFEKHQISLVLMTERSYLGIELVSAASARDAFDAGRAMLAGGIFTIYFDEVEVVHDPAVCARKILELGGVVDRRRRDAHSH